MSRLASLRITAFICVLSGASTPPAHGSIVVVPDDYPTIQQAADASDTVWVRGGDYPERLNLGGRDMESVVIRRHPDSATRPRVGALALDTPWALVFNMQGLDIAGPVRLANGGHGYPYVIESCRLDSGVVTLNSGGLLLTITNSRIVGNIAIAGEADVHMYADTVFGGLTLPSYHGGFAHTFQVTNCVFKGPGGIGVAIAEEGRGYVMDNQIDGFETGILGTFGGTLDVKRNLISNCGRGIAFRGSVLNVRDNQVHGCGTGIDVWTSDNDPVIIAENHILGSAGVGIRAISPQGWLDIQGNIVGRSGSHGFVVETFSYGDDYPPIPLAHNTSFANQGSGFALSHDTRDVVGHSSPRMMHNIAYGNARQALEWSSTGSYPETPLAELDHSCNDWFANALGTVSGTPASPLDLEVDPLFCDVASDSVSLQAGSPLLQAPGCGLIGARGMGCETTATTLTLFAVERTSGGVRIRWRLGEGTAAEIWVERADGESGPWARIATDRVIEADATVDIDRDAAADRPYWYRLVARSGGSTEVLSQPFESRPTSPVSFALEVASPASASRKARLTFSVPHAGSIAIEALDLQGRSVAVLARGVWPAGRHSVAWPPDGATAAAIYFMRYRYPGGQTVRKLVVVP